MIELQREGFTRVVFGSLSINALFERRGRWEVSVRRASGEIVEKRGQGSLDLLAVVQEVM